MDPDRDLDDYLAVVHQMEPFPRTADEWRERQRLAMPEEFRRHLVGELAGRVVAAATLTDNQWAANAVNVRIVVDAAHRGSGCGRAMVAAVDALLAERAPDEMEVVVADDDESSRAWVERRGFRLYNHMIRSRLDLAEFEAGEHRQAVDRAEAAGIQFDAPDDLDRLYALYARLVVDTPDRLEARSREQFRRGLEERTGGVVLVASDGEVWTGLAIAAPSGDDGAFNEFTGVLPEHRGRGIATALKILVSEELVRQGRRWVQTMNNALNGPMLAVNRSLGYRPEAGRLFLRRKLAT
jgi:GNAT superfamily N-acetyltransferase